MCLSSTSSNGAIFFGGFDSSTAPLTYTPLLTNPVSTATFYAKGEASSEYFIGVKSIEINQKVVRINPTLLSINATGHGGTKISTLDKYTVLETSIYKAVVNAFVKELNVPRVPSVAPFGACFSTKNIGTAYTGPAVPTIDLVLQSKDVYWRIHGANSMVRLLHCPISKFSPQRPHSTCLERSINSPVYHRNQTKNTSCVKLTIDLGAQYLWVDCEKEPTPGCSNNTCTLTPENSYYGFSTTGTVGTDALSVQSAVGGAPVTLSKFLFVCSNTGVLEKTCYWCHWHGRARKDKILTVCLKRKFGVSSTSIDGAIYFGEFDSSTAPLTYTSLLINAISRARFAVKGELSSEY
ncbi:hypothetical protein POM88_026864 [Heracleum sosnowskyi]|uniref:Xylanase inhibitor C-terminal domain-containing protein n=1 Tax=Heracleum sosnowskyi TaxID=360622 RepID=A0AAD8I7J8_9APIA|nr:hypothetical protein POM88_026864 [Heracleum sosnowskyi]